MDLPIFTKQPPAVGIEHAVAKSELHGASL
jgi:hypothetical protein